ncbi:MAG TPA: hypothetical protein VLM38_19190 [Blastocatellia bacterium]|nr:hypothetical protein [Blastocatellia bacterium]
MRQEIYPGLALAVTAVASLIVHQAMAAPKQPGTTRHQREFLRLARSELATSKSCVEAKEYLRGLPLKQRLSVARAVVNDPDANIGYLGANILIEHGYARDAVPALAAILASGRDQTQLSGRFGYDWLHGDDDTLFLRLVIRINRYLLANLSKYTGEERRRVEGLLMGGLFEKPSEPFSKAKAKKLISKWESQLKGRR